MKIVYLWGSDFSVVLGEDLIRENDSYIVVPANDSAFPNDLQDGACKAFGDRVIKVSYDQEELVRVIEVLDPDVIISMGWRRILGGGVLQKLSGKIILNIHPALLPEYKGYHTEPYVIMNDEKEHGITAHYLEAGLDSGDIVHQARFSISKFSTTNSIKAQVNEIMPHFLRELFLIIRSGKIRRVVQDEKLNKIVAPKRRPQDSEIDSGKTLDELYDTLRACNDERYPAFFYVNGERVFISIWRDKEACREHDLEI
ncbi:formyltransferase family protein [Pseudomonas sp. SDO5271_S396]